ncbi:hypothetical protein [Fontibacillus sp. BL9]|uniref:hypothetical protein n=1 Tax=Fontibacillus sp. BL9 TaxID=3389971 RepID=UPI00397D3EA0
MNHREEQRNDLRLVGDSMSNGGFYGKVSLTGDAEFNGNVDCLSLKSTGNIKVDGSLRSGTLKTTGDLKIEGGLTVTEMSATGEVWVKESISGENMKIFGTCTVMSGIQTERFKLKGVVQSEGMLNSETVEMVLFGKSYAAEIVGTRIEVQPFGAQKWVPWLRMRGTPELEAQVIEGDVVSLENTKADTVRGGEVRIGPGCRIRLVEYSKSFHQDRQSEVAESVRVTEH